MPALNRVQLIGRLGRDPESHFTPTGKKVAHFSIAVSNQWDGRDGEMKEYTEWVNIEAWGRLAQVCQEYIHKGSLIYLEGRLKTNKYEVNGEPRYFTKVIAQSLQFLPDNTTGDTVVEKGKAIDEGEFELREVA
jgi:single-strand DNA-binding protein